MSTSHAPAGLTLTTVATEAAAHELAGKLIEQRLAACVQVVGGVVSHFIWDGERQSAAEWLLIIKSTTAKRPEIEGALARWHSYEVPEILHVDAAGGSARYLAWLTAAVGGR